jgi:type VI secretion system protein ImpK
MPTATNNSQNMSFDFTSKLKSKQIPNLANLCTDLFLLIVYLRESQVFDPPDVLYDRIVSLFNAMERKAKEARIVDSDIQDAKYALVALIDQTVGWASRLELEFFGTSVAGAEFFNKLEREKKAEARDEVLEIYYLCLMLGFEGRYVGDPGKLQAYIKEFQKKLSSEELESLSPHGERPKEAIKRSRRSISWWMPLAFAGACLVASVLVFILLEQRMTDWAATIVAQIQRFFG